MDRECVDLSLKQNTAIYLLNIVVAFFYLVVFIISSLFYCYFQFILYLYFFCVSYWFMFLGKYVVREKYVWLEW